MAEIVTRVDDLDGSTEDVQNIQFGFRGKTYGIDLGPSSQQALADALAPFLEKATEQRGAAAAPRARRSSSSASNSNEIAAIRKWAQDNQVTYRNAQGEMTTLGERGRIPEEVKQAYYDAH